MAPAPSTRKIYLYHYITFGLYFFYWCSRSRTDINHSANQKLIPTTWLLALPGGNYWWMWQYAQALQHVSYRRLKAADTFLIYLIASHAWLLLTFGFQPSFSWGNHTGNFSHFLIALLIIYAVVCFLLEITGAAFFCATMQHKINALRAASHPVTNPVG